MQFDEYAQVLVERLGLRGTEPLHVGTHLFDDLDLDSAQTYEVLVITEAAAGLVGSPPGVDELETLGDAFAYYEAVVVQMSSLNGAISKQS